MGSHTEIGNSAVCPAVLALAKPEDGSCLGETGRFLEQIYVPPGRDPWAPGGGFGIRSRFAGSGRFSGWTCPLVGIFEEKSAEHRYSGRCLEFDTWINLTHPFGFDPIALVYFLSSTRSQKRTEMVQPRTPSNVYIYIYMAILQDPLKRGHNSSRAQSVLS